MEKLDYKLSNIYKMIVNLDKSVKRLKRNSDKDDIEYLQDSIVARFNILVESSWKLLKLYMEEKGVSDLSGAPKDVINKALQINFLSPEEHKKFLNFISLRNMASHIYDEPGYLLVVDAAPIVVELTKTIVERVKLKSQE